MKQRALAQLAQALPRQSSVSEATRCQYGSSTADSRSSARSPVVVWVSTSADFVPNPAEVASVHRVALADIERKDAFSFTTIPESTRRVIRFRHAGQHIHAPTAALIYQFAEVLAGRSTRVAELEQPVFAWR